MNLVHPDTVVYFPKCWRSGDINAWCRCRGWLPKNRQGLIWVFVDQMAEVWGGRHLGREYVALRFV